MKFLWNWDKQSESVYETTLADLQNTDPDVIAKDVFAPEWAENGGLLPQTEDYLWVQFEFEDNGKDQNIFQGDSLNLEWTFNASQEEGTKSGAPAFYYTIRHKEKEVPVVSTSFYLLFLIVLPFCKFKKFTKLFFGDTGAHRIFNELCPFGV